MSSLMHRASITRAELPLWMCDIEAQLAAKLTQYRPLSYLIILLDPSFSYRTELALPVFCKPEGKQVVTFMRIII